MNQECLSVSQLQPWIEKICQKKKTHSSGWKDVGECSGGSRWRFFFFVCLFFSPREFRSIYVEKLKVVFHIVFTCSIVKPKYILPIHTSYRIRFIIIHSSILCNGCEANSGHQWAKTGFICSSLGHCKSICSLFVFNFIDKVQPAFITPSAGSECELHAFQNTRKDNVLFLPIHLS